MTDALNRSPNRTKPARIPNKTCDAHLFTLQLEWLQNVYEYLLDAKWFITSQRQYLAQRAKPFVF
jgi:hypothetical protein